MPLEERDELRLRDPRENGRVRDLVAVQVEDREDGAVPAGVEELVRVPARGERPRLGLAVADDARHQEVGVVEGRAERVGERVPELAALVDRARCLGRRVARDAAGERELPEQLPEPFLVLGDRGVELRVRPLEVRVRDVRRPAVPGTRDEDRVELPRPDGPVQVRVDEVEARRRAEVAEQPRLHVLPRQRLAEERVVEEVDLSDGEVVRRAPVRVEEPELVVVEGAGGLSRGLSCRPCPQSAGYGSRPGRSRCRRPCGHRAGGRGRAGSAARTP